MEDALYQHCLRPLFTQNIVQDLQQRRSLNIYGASGQGRERLLEDIQNFQWDTQTKVLLLDMKTCRQQYSTFLCELWLQFGGTGDTPSDLGRVITELEKSGQHIILLLHHFDSLLDNPDILGQFDANFFDNLNAIRNKPHMSLVCVTQRVYTTMMFSGEQQHPASVLHLEERPLVQLTQDEIKYEIKRRISELSGKELDEFAQVVYNSVEPYKILECFCHHYRNEADVQFNLSERLKKWEKEYNQRYGWFTSRNFYRISSGLVTLLRALRIPQLFDKVLAVIKAVFGDMWTAIFEWWTGKQRERDDKSKK